MDDLISRQAAIDAVYDAFCYAYCDNCEKEMNEDLCGDCHRKYQNWSASKKIIEKVINNLPPAQPVEDARAMCGECDAWNQYKNYPQPGWIPCSERMPFVGKVLAQTNGGIIHEVFYWGKNGDDHDVWARIDGVTYWDAEIAAWMPLPKPWEGKEQ